MADQATSGATRYMQGIAVPSSSVRPQEFFARTRRHLTTETVRTFAGLGGQDLIEIRKSDVIAGVVVRFTGSLTSTPGAGSVATTRRWPYDLIRGIRFTANGQSNLISASGLKLKAREYMSKTDLTDRGVSQSVAGATVTHGTLAKASESWGVGSGATAIGAGTYDVDLEWFVPVAEDQIDLAGAIFAATSSTDLTLAIDWASSAELLTLTGGATAALAGTLEVQSVKYSVPIGSDGQIVVPDLSLFHSLIQTRHSNVLGVGENELRIVGQGAGKSLLRAYFQTWNGSAPQTPLAMSATNYARQAWRYAGNETPDEWVSGRSMRIGNERAYNADIGGVWGFGSHEFATENAFRDVVDMGTTSDLRLVIGIANGASLTSPAVEMVTETIFVAGAGA